METRRLETLKQIAAGVAARCGSNCDVVIHDVSEPERIINVNAVLDELIDQSVAMVGKPVALMNKEDKVRAIQFLNQSGAFLVTKSGDKVAKYFGISKYTLYSYIDANKDGDK